MRQWLDDRGVHGEHRIEQVRQADAVRLRHQAEPMPVAIEAPWSAVARNLATRLAMRYSNSLASLLAGSSLVARMAGASQDLIGREAIAPRPWRIPVRPICVPDRPI